MTLLAAVAGGRCAPARWSCAPIYLWQPLCWSAQLRPRPVESGADSLLRHRDRGAERLGEQADAQLLQLPPDLVDEVRQRSGWRQGAELGIGVLTAQDGGPALLVAGRVGPQ